MEAVVADLASAPITEPLRATLAFLGQVTSAPETLTRESAERVLALGVTKQQLEDALAVGWAFNIINRLADAFVFEVGPQAAFESAANQLLKRGYKL